MKFTFLLFLLFVGTCFSSCNQILKQGITGWWTIDTIYYKNQEIKFCLLSNSITFKSNSCELPRSPNICDGLNITATNGTWDVIQKTSRHISLEIKTSNKIFSGKHVVTFSGDEKNKLLKMVIESSELYIVCRKGLYNYDANKDLTRKLEEKSGTAIKNNL